MLQLSSRSDLTLLDSLVRFWYKLNDYNNLTHVLLSLSRNVELNG